MLIVDTGVLLAAADTSDPDHGICAAIVANETGPLIAPPLVIAETAYLALPVFAGSWWVGIRGVWVGALQTLVCEDENYPRPCVDGS